MSGKPRNGMDMLVSALDRRRKTEKEQLVDLGRSPVWDEGKGYGGIAPNELLMRVLHGPYDPHIEKNRLPDWMNITTKSEPAPKSNKVKPAVKEIRPPGWKAQNFRELTNAYKEGWQPPERDAAAEAAYRPEDWRPGNFSELSEAIKTGWKSPAMKAQDAAAELPNQTSRAAQKTKAAVSTPSPQNAAQKLSGKLNLTNSPTTNPYSEAQRDEKAPGFANGTLFIGPKQEKTAKTSPDKSKKGIPGKEDWNKAVDKSAVHPPIKKFDKPATDSLPKSADGTISMPTVQKVFGKNAAKYNRVKSYSREISAAAGEFGVDPRLLSSVLYNEQKHLERLENLKDVGRFLWKGDSSIGLGQVKPETARGLMVKYPELAKKFPGAQTKAGMLWTLMQPDANIYLAAANLKEIQDAWRPYIKSQEELNGVAATIYHRTPVPPHKNPRFNDRGKEILNDMYLFE